MKVVRRVPFAHRRRSGEAQCIAMPASTTTVPALVNARLIDEGTTNAIESVHMRLRKIIKTRGHFPTDEAATKLIWLALRNITADWTRPTRQWKAAMNQFAIMYADRFKPSAA